MRVILFCIALLLMPLLGYCGQSVVKADKLEASVYYDIVSQKGEIIQMRVQYDDSTPNANVYDLHFYPRERMPDGEYEYSCLSTEGGIVIFKFEVKDSSLKKAQVDTSYKPSLWVVEEEKILTLKSKDGFEILFTFSFKAGQIENVNIKPKVNPFLS